MIKLERSWVFLMLLFVSVVLLALPLQAGWAMPPESPLNEGTVPPKPHHRTSEGPSRPYIPPPIANAFAAGTMRDQKIGPDGGRLDIPMGDGRCILVELEKGRLTEDVVFEVTLADQAVTPPDTCNDANIASRLCKSSVQYWVKAWHSSNGQPFAPGERFPLPYSQVLCYTSAELALAADQNPDNLLIAYFDETTQQWVPVPTRADRVNRNVGALIDHTSLWALTARPAGSTVLSGTLALTSGAVVTATALPAAPTRLPDLDGGTPQ